jgi:hypothetical protein
VAALLRYTVQHCNLYLQKCVLHTHICIPRSSYDSACTCSISEIRDCTDCSSCFAVSRMIAGAQSSAARESSGYQSEAP